MKKEHLTKQLFELKVKTDSVESRIKSTMAGLKQEYIAIMEQIAEVESHLDNLTGKLDASATEKRLKKMKKAIMDADNDDVEKQIVQMFNQIKKKRKVAYSVLLPTFPQPIINDSSATPPSALISSTVPTSAPTNIINNTPSSNTSSTSSLINQFNSMAVS
eukprot:TRINITY_DN2902_c0_g1_i1.p1 TRINITY_DN2902_c0_g1~~TRINITY_DN2902_c0_g1_i1.p1  ORF type:complete len:161 (+),score=39.39 TRINITY_DN2902_c0_g1_i1:310-792(+)